MRTWEANELQRRQISGSASSFGYSETTGSHQFDWSDQGRQLYV